MAKRHIASVRHKHRSERRQESLKEVILLLNKLATALITITALFFILRGFTMDSETKLLPSNTIYLSSIGVLGQPDEDLSSEKLVCGMPYIFYINVTGDELNDCRFTVSTTDGRVIEEKDAVEMQGIAAVVYSVNTLDVFRATFTCYDAYGSRHRSEYVYRCCPLGTVC